MATEYEYRFLVHSFMPILEQLRAIGAQEIGTEVQMRRWVYGLAPKAEDTRWLRLRTDGCKTTLTLKHMRATSMFTEETQVEVGDFDAAHAILTQIGLSARYQENRRRTFRIVDIPASVMLDAWPDLPPIVEIESADLSSLLSACHRMGLEPLNRTNATIDQLWQMAARSEFGVNEA